MAQRFTITHYGTVTGPLPMIGYPDIVDRRYIMKGQLSWLDPFSQQVTPDLS